MLAFLHLTYTNHMQNTTIQNTTNRLFNLVIHDHQQNSLNFLWPPLFWHSRLWKPEEMTLLSGYVAEVWRYRHCCCGYFWPKISATSIRISFTAALVGLLIYFIITYQASNEVNVIPYLPLRTNTGKGLETCYSTTYMSQTRDQQRFTISEVAADWHEPMVPQLIMWPSTACANRQLDLRCS